MAEEETTETHDSIIDEVRSALGKLLGDGSLKVTEGESEEPEGEEGDELLPPRQAEQSMAAKVREAVGNITINVNPGDAKKEDPKPVEEGPPGRPPFLRKLIGLAD